MSNYFNSLNLRQQLEQLGKCRFMSSDEFNKGTQALQGKKIVIIGCGAQGLNQGLCLKESGLDVSYALRPEAIVEQRQSYKNAINHGFKVGTYKEVIPTADLVINLTPDKQHSAVVKEVSPLLKDGAAFGYSHGFNIVEEGVIFKPTITVIMMAPKAPGSEVLAEFRAGFGVPTLICVHPNNDPQNNGLEIAKAWACGTGGHRAGVLESSFVAEVKSDLLGEQTILCGVLQAGTVFAYNYLVAQGETPEYVVKLLQKGWAVQANAVKLGGLTLLLDRFSPYARQRVIELADYLKVQFDQLFHKHIDDIISGKFSSKLIEDWHNNDKNLLAWRKHFSEHPFENIAPSQEEITEQEYYDNAVILAAFIKAGVELAFEVMVKSGIKQESAYYESLHELPLLANLIDKNKLYQMNLIISDTAEYGNYLFAIPAVEILNNSLPSKLITGDLGRAEYITKIIDNKKLAADLDRSRNHPVEIIGKTLRSYMEQARNKS